MHACATLITHPAVGTAKETNMEDFEGQLVSIPATPARYRDNASDQWRPLAEGSLVTDPDAPSAPVHVP